MGYVPQVKNPWFRLFHFEVQINFCVKQIQRIENLLRGNSPFLQQLVDAKLKWIFVLLSAVICARIIKVII